MNDGCPYCRLITDHILESERPLEQAFPVEIIGAAPGGGWDVRKDGLVYNAQPSMWPSHNPGDTELAAWLDPQLRNQMQILTGRTVFELANIFESEEPTAVVYRLYLVGAGALEDPVLPVARALDVESSQQWERGETRPLYNVAAGAGRVVAATLATTSGEPMFARCYNEDGELQWSRQPSDLAWPGGFILTGSRPARSCAIAALDSQAVFGGDGSWIFASGQHHHILAFRLTDELDEEGELVTAEGALLWIAGHGGQVHGVSAGRVDAEDPETLRVAAASTGNSTSGSQTHTMAVYSGYHVAEPEGGEPPHDGAKIWGDRPQTSGTVETEDEPPETVPWTLDVGLFDCSIAGDKAAWCGSQSLEGHYAFEDYPPPPAGFLQVRDTGTGTLAWEADPVENETWRSVEISGEVVVVAGYYQAEEFVSPTEENLAAYPWIDESEGGLILTTYGVVRTYSLSGAPGWVAKTPVRVTNPVDGTDDAARWWGVAVVPDHDTPEGEVAGLVVSVGQRDSDSLTTRTYALADGSAHWTHDHGVTLQAVAIAALLQAEEAS